MDLSFLLWVILDRDSMRSFFSLSPHDFSIPFFFPFSHIYSKWVVGWLWLLCQFSAIRGPMLSMLSGFLGESGLGNDSHFSTYVRYRYSQGFAELPRNNIAEHIRYFSCITHPFRQCFPMHKVLLSGENILASPPSKVPNFMRNIKPSPTLPEFSQLTSIRH